MSVSNFYLAHSCLSYAWPARAHKASRTLALSRLEALPLADVRVAKLGRFGERGGDVGRAVFRQHGAPSEHRAAPRHRRLDEVEQPPRAHAPALARPLVGH